MEDRIERARPSLFVGADLGSQAAAQAATKNMVCPFPRSWYPADSPCAETDETVIDYEQDPFVAPEDKARLQKLVDDVTSFGPKLKMLGYIALGLTAVWLAIRGLDAYATLSER